MMEKPFHLAIVVGRFQMLHAGHGEMIDLALTLAARTAVLIGSAQEAGTEKNPLSYAQREACLRQLYGDRVEVYPLPDVGLGNNARWGEHVLAEAARLCGAAPDLAVSGQEARRLSWYDGLPIAELTIPKTISISATEMRRWLEEDARERWQRYAPAPLWQNYDLLRRAVLSAKGRGSTQSI